MLERSENTKPCLTALEWRITGRCNEACVYCYGPLKVIHPSSDVLQAILEKLVTYPVGIVRFSGGEPLLVRGIESIIHRLFDAGKQIVLSTNGVNFVRLRPKLDRSLSKLNLSIDGYDRTTHSLGGRKPNSFDRAVEALSSFTTVPPAYRVKVGTVLTARNATEPCLLEKMYALLTSKRVDRWKIYQYVPEGPITDSSLCLDDRTFDELKNQLSRYISVLSTRNHLEVNFASAAIRSGAYFIVQPFGDVIVPVGDSKATFEHQIGNILSNDADELLRRWHQISNAANHLANVSLTKTMKEW